MRYKLPANVNARVLSTAWLHGESFTFDGTSKDLAVQACRRGANVGTEIMANYGGQVKANADRFVMIEDSREDWSYLYPQRLR